MQDLLDFRGAAERGATQRRSRQLPFKPAKFTHQLPFTPSPIHTSQVHIATPIHTISCSHQPKFTHQLRFTPVKFTQHLPFTPSPIHTISRSHHPTFTCPPSPSLSGSWGTFLGKLIQSLMDILRVSEPRLLRNLGKRCSALASRNGLLFTSCSHPNATGGQRCFTRTGPHREPRSTAGSAGGLEGKLARLFLRPVAYGWLLCFKTVERNQKNIL